MKMVAATQSLRHLLPALALAAFLSGCASGPEPLYQWGSYQEQVYAHLQGESREAQIEAMERDVGKIEASGKTAPPGFYAHLGLLYAETGHDAEAASCFGKEKARFPESAVFMDFLLNKYRQ
ncbi:MAG: DUF4810 domain-containing protein [Azoarcus sp.]|jgi:hypothetical protein|nr:DUF4810 domain-containing protein [Azoarcus sp.]